MNTPISSWMRAAREGRSWTQDDLIERMRAEVGWAPSRPNLSGYENGKADNAKPETLAKFYRFWDAQEEPRPDLTPKVVPEPVDLATALMELAAELRASRQEREALEGRLRTLEAAVALLAPPTRGAPQGRSAPLGSAR